MSEVRLIDANALKQDLRQYFTDGVLDGVSAKLAFNQILHDIDNAPTVELFCAYLSDGEVRQPCVEAPCKHERPQDDLISRSELKAFIKKYYKQTSQIKSLLSFIDTQKDGARMTDHKCFTLHRNKTTCDVCGADLNAVK